MTRMRYHDIVKNMQEVQAMVKDFHQPRFPHMDVIKVAEWTYEIQLALAGYKKEDITVELINGVLSVKGDWATDAVDYLVEGISKKKFHKHIPIQEHIKVKGVRMKDGMLSIDLVKEVPEEEKPKTFDIK